MHNNYTNHSSNDLLVSISCHVWLRLCSTLRAVLNLNINKIFIRHSCHLHVTRDLHVVDIIQVLAIVGDGVRHYVDLDGELFLRGFDDQLKHTLWNGCSVTSHGVKTSFDMAKDN